MIALQVCISFPFLSFPFPFPFPFPFLSFFPNVKTSLQHCYSHRHIIVLYVPSITPIAAKVVNEGTPFNFIATLSSGTLPIQWVLETGPVGLTIGSSDGNIQWSNPIASANPYTVRIRASNEIGSEAKSFSLRVNPIYYAGIHLILSIIQFR